MPTSETEAEIRPLLKGDDDVAKRTFTDEVLDERTAAILRAKSPDERLAIAARLWELAAQLVRDMIRSQHPDWSAQEVEREGVRRMSHGAF
jgi:hypothetical protein